MVTSNQAIPYPRSDASAILGRLRDGPPVCRYCNNEFANRPGRDQTGYCEICRGWQQSYRGPPRPSLCGSCFNNVGTFKAKPKCASQMYQMADGTWRDRFDQDYKLTGGRNGERERDPVEPTHRGATYECDSYELIRETREELRLRDPLKFYDKHRQFQKF